jgi:hypothetical protein
LISLPREVFMPARTDDEPGNGVPTPTLWRPAGGAEQGRGFVS